MEATALDAATTAGAVPSLNEHLELISTRYQPTGLEWHGESCEIKWMEDSRSRKQKCVGETLKHLLILRFPTYTMLLCYCSINTAD
ncbi:unnamed protein product [Bursaphelenchus okinawaensis]|uniref:Uncharacterized protein n=1 Tax=Bursaphelenchus okinawaensis TaxID=465554 RepID=A0A811K8Z1_9BILA|nr:unnamed protein product [Bursaphelenchus okinawaensis]CAG9094545.1 unnamed protein product [Bursaphelenchus okinawaensis]